MDFRIGKYSIRMKADKFSQSTAVIQINNKETKEVWKGYYNIRTRKKYEKFVADLENDIIPPKFKLYKKPKDKMSEVEISNVKKLKELRGE